MILPCPSEETSKKDFRLPAIIPIVLYNGENNWTAALRFKEMLNGYEESDLQSLASRQFHHFTKWFTRIVCSNISKESFDHVVKMLKQSSPEEVGTVISNLAQTLKKAQDEAKQEEIQQGVQQGARENRLR